MVRTGNVVIGGGWWWWWGGGGGKVEIGGREWGSDEKGGSGVGWR